MKSIAKSFLATLAFVGTLGVSAPSFGQETDPCSCNCCMYDTPGEEPGIKCTQHHVDISLGFITYHFLVTVCEGGQEYWDLV